MQDLEKLREQIDQIDTTLLEKIKERIAIMQQIGIVKKTLQKETRDFDREDTKRDVLVQKAKELGIPEKVVLGVWQVFFEESVEIEK